MNDTLKKILVNNAGVFLIALLSAVFALAGYVLLIRADTNTALYQDGVNAQAIIRDNAILDQLVPEVAQIKQLSQDTNDKVDLLIHK